MSSKKSSTCGEIATLARLTRGTDWHFSVFTQTVCHAHLLAFPLLLIDFLKDGVLAGQPQQQCSGDLSGQLIGNVVHHHVTAAVQGGDLNLKAKVKSTVGKDSFEVSHNEAL